MKAKSNTIFFIALFCSLFLLSGCGSSEISDAKAYLNYLANPENGLVKEKTVSGIKYKVKYLPAGYLAYNEAKNTSLSQTEKKQLLNQYANSLTFLLNLGPAEGEKFDITHLNVANYGEFAQRIEQMAFEAQNWMSISVQGKEYKPSLVRLETVNALGNDRNFLVVFTTPEGGKEDLRKNDMCFVYTDELFETGTNKFIFKSDDLNNIPEFIF